ncbi:MAG: hypothetical protein U1F43_27095 [Myxococcota bacterium]
MILGLALALGLVIAFDQLASAGEAGRTAVRGIESWHELVLALALVAPLGATALLPWSGVEVAPPVVRANLGALLLLALGIGATVAAALLVDHDGWTFYTPYAQSPPPIDTAHALDVVGLGLRALAGVVACLAGAYALRPTSPLAAASFGAGALCLALAFVVSAGATSPTDRGWLDTGAALMPALGLVTALAAGHPAWRRASLAWMVVAAALLAVGVVAQLVAATDDARHVSITLVAVARSHALEGAALAAWLAGLHQVAPDVDRRRDRRARWPAVGAGVGLLVSTAADLALGTSGLPRRYAMYDPSYPLRTMIGAAGAIVAGACVIWALVELVPRRR